MCQELGAQAPPAAGTKRKPIANPRTSEARIIDPSVTPQVAGEVFSGRESRALREARGSWIDVVPVRGDVSKWMALGLGRGEASLFETPKEDRLVLDEVPARTVAEAEGREYVGLLGLLLGGVDRGTMAASRAWEIVRKLARSSFRMSTDLYDEVLRQLKEPD